MTGLTPEARAILRAAVEERHLFRFVTERGSDGYPSSGLLEISREVLALLDAIDERDQLAAAVERLRKQHRSFGIYDECDCPDDAKGEGHVDIYEVGLTCNKIYDICAECCRDDIYQAEDCANNHNHRLGERFHCRTIENLEGEMIPSDGRN